MLKIAGAMKKSNVARFVARMHILRHRGGIPLSLSVAIASASSIGFWAFAARIYPSETLGLQSAIISAMFLVAGIAQLSLTNVMTRFVPSAGASTRRLVGGAYVLSLIITPLVALLFLAGLSFWTPALGILRANLAMMFWFVLATPMWCLFTLQDSVLIGLQHPAWLPLKNTVFALTKIVLFMLLALPLAPMGIFAAWTIAGSVMVLGCAYLFFLRLIPRHSVASTACAEPLNLRRMARYAASAYAGSLLLLMITTVLPLMVTHRLGFSANAYFTLCWLIIASLQMASGTIALPLRVEAAYDRAQLKTYTQRALVRSLRLALPLTLVMLIGAPYVLAIFGAEYVLEATLLLRLLAIGMLPNVIITLYLGVARVQDRMGALARVMGGLCTMMLSLNILLMPPYGIIGIGIAWVISQTVMAILISIFFLWPLWRR
ncbi:MAG: polysaccharide biosynthesis C-terminal domain-containing protein [Chloroflexales bacterium]|nr:polysaccharide biosynthesis C-terminal domain-containing protein [Chloroflexales bacterium]